MYLTEGIYYYKSPMAIAGLEYYVRHYEPILPKKIIFEDYKMRKLGNKVDSRGNTQVAIQDQFADIISLYAINIKGTTTLASAADEEDTVISVTSASGAVAGEAINITENGKIVQCIVKSISGTDITLSCPLTRGFSTSAVVEFGAWNANVDGSSTNKSFVIKPPAGVKWDITGIKFNLNDATEMEDALFGGATALTNGISVTRINGTHNKILEVTNNGGFEEQHATLSYSSKPPAGEYGVSADLSFNNSFGVVSRLDGGEGDYLQLLVRDNLTVLTKMVMTARGHEVED